MPNRVARLGLGASEKETLQTFRARPEDTMSFFLDNHSECLLTCTDGVATWTNPTPFKQLDNKLNGRQPSLPHTAFVALGTNGRFFVAFKDGSHSFDFGRAKLNSTVTKEIAAKGTPVSVAFGFQKAYCIVYAKGAMHNALPSPLVDLVRAEKKMQRINFVCLSPTNRDAFAVINNDGSTVVKGNKSLRNSLNEDVKQGEVAKSIFMGLGNAFAMHIVDKAPTVKPTGAKSASPGKDTPTTPQGVHHKEEQSAKKSQVSSEDDLLAAFKKACEGRTIRAELEREHVAKIAKLNEQLKEVERAKEEQQRLELLVFIKHTVMELMIKKGVTKSQETMDSVVFNKSIDKTPVFKHFVKALQLHGQSGQIGGGSGGGLSKTLPSPTSVYDLLTAAPLLLGYHGTPAHDAMMSIMEDGFNPKKRGSSTGQAHGQGEYFDTNLALSPHYANKCGKGGYVVGCLVLNHRSFVKDILHQQHYPCLVVDNPAEIAAEGTFCLPVFVLGSSSSIPTHMKTLAAKVAYNKSLMTVSPIANAAPRPPASTTFEFLDDKGHWVPMSQTVSNELSVRLAAGDQAHTMTINQFRYTFNFNTMFQTNLDTSKRRQIRAS